MASWSWVVADINNDAMLLHAKTTDVRTGDSTIQELWMQTKWHYLQFTLAYGDTQSVD